MNQLCCSLHSLHSNVCLYVCFWLVSHALAVGQLFRSTADQNKTRVHQILMVNHLWDIMETSYWHQLLVLLVFFLLAGLYVVASTEYTFYDCARSTNNLQSKKHKISRHDEINLLKAYQNEEGWNHRIIQKISKQ